MADIPKSPLTGQQDVLLLSKAPTADIVTVARRAFGDFSYMFEGVPTLSLWLCRQTGLKFFDPMICGDDRFYEILNNLPWYYPTDKSEYDTASRYVPPQSCVLDVGCGAGEFARYIPADASFRGLELSQSAIQRARAAGRDVLCETIEEHASRNAGRYDVVTSFQVIEHVPDPLGFVRSMVDCAKPSGLVILATPNDDSFVGLEINNILNMPPHHVTRWPSQTLRYVLKKAGLLDISILTEPLAPVHEEMFFTGLVVRALLNNGSKQLEFVRADFGFRLLNKISKSMARFLKRGHREGAGYVLGHTVLAIGRKA